MSGWMDRAAYCLHSVASVAPIPTALVRAWVKGEEENRKLYLREVADEERISLCRTDRFNRCGIMREFRHLPPDDPFLSR
jgi:hypothetical protein